MRIIGCGFARLPADAGDAGHQHRRGSEQDSPTRRATTQRVLLEPRKTGFSVGIEATGSMQWFVNLAGRAWNRMPGGSSGKRFEQPNHENKSMIGEMRTYFYHFLVQRRFPADLVTYERTDGPAGLAATPPSVGEATGQNTKCAAGDWL